MHSLGGCSSAGRPSADQLSSAGHYCQPVTCQHRLTVRSLPQEELKMTKESKSCRWCEDSTSELILFSKSKDKIVGFCSEECWQSFSEILFNVSLSFRPFGRFLWSSFWSFHWSLPWPLSLTVSPATFLALSTLFGCISA